MPFKRFETWGKWFDYWSLRLIVVGMGSLIALVGWGAYANAAIHGHASNAIRASMLAAVAGAWGIGTLYLLDLLDRGLGWLWHKLDAGLSE